MGVGICVWSSEDKFQKSVLSFNHMRPWDETQVFRLGGNLYQLSRLTSQRYLGVINYCSLLMYWLAIQMEMVHINPHLKFLNKKLGISYTEFWSFLPPYCEALLPSKPCLYFNLLVICLVVYLLNLNMDACLPFGVVFRGRLIYILLISFLFLEIVHFFLRIDLTLLMCFSFCP